MNASQEYIAISANSIKTKSAKQTDVELSETTGKKLVNLLDYSRDSLADYFVSLGETKFRATQVIQWIHQHGITDFEQMTNLSKALRVKLQASCTVKMPEVVLKKVSPDLTIKYLIKLDCGNCVEAVYIPENSRATLCISSQVGCALNCTFCSTAQQGFNRNLTTAEIISQLWLVHFDILNNHTESNSTGALPRVSNIVFMGMGEPLLNYDNVISAAKLMLDDYAFGLSKYRVTLSTSGVLPNLLRLSREHSSVPIALAVSLHAPIDELRNQIVPINKKYPLDQLLAACKIFFGANSKRKVTFEYVMLDGVNDSPKHAKQLIRILEGVPAKVNLIPFNPFPNTIYNCSSLPTIKKFHDILNKSGIITTIRKTRGDEISAACGQLAGDFKDRTSRSRLMKNKQLKLKQQTQ